MQEKPEYSHGTIVETDIKDEMKQSFMDYAMSVIVSRALPDVRDGLKPVHRRILYAMHELNMQPEKPFKKSARLVGEVLGKFHPHGDTAVYDAMVRMAQDFSTRYLMVDGQGNFGSVDDDPPAAMRYTEARLSKIAVEMLTDLEANTVNWSPNFDGTLEEPNVLPALVPNLLINGVTGIAVGMATSIPPHNLEEVTSALVHLINNKDASSLELHNFVKGPDFPTGGIILGDQGIKQAYTTGRGSVTIRSVLEVEENKKGRLSIVVSEIPYQVSKRRLLEQIADLVRDKKLEGISDLRDESDKDGMRVVIELKRDAVPKVVINNLYKHTLLQSNFGITLLALVNRQPVVLDLRTILEEYVKHRQEIITRRTQFFLDKALARDHIVQGFLIVQENIDAVIKIIRASDSTNEAHEKLMSGFQLSTAQATAVLDMQLRRLTALEKKKLEDEHMDLLSKITDFRDILSRPERVDTIMKEELARVTEKHKDKRRTQLLPDPGSFRNEDLIPDEQMAVFITNQGYIKRVPLGEFENQQRGGRGKGGLTTREDDYVKHFFVSSNHASVLFITSRGVVYDLKVYNLPEAGRQAKGSSITNLLPLAQDEQVTAVIQVSEFLDDHYLVMLTKNGIIKKSNLSYFKNIRSSGIIAINLDEGDSLGWVGLSDGDSNILIGTRKGFAIRYHEKTVRPLGRSTRGVKAISLREGDSIVSFDLVSGDLLPKSDDVIEDENEVLENEVPEEEAETETDENEEVEEPGNGVPTLLTVTTDGYGKRTPVTSYRLQSRGGLGVINIKLKEDSQVGSILIVSPDQEIIIATFKGVVIRQKVSEIRTMGRSTKGVRLQRLDNDDKVMAVQLVIDTEQEHVETVKDGTDTYTGVPDPGAQNNDSETVNPEEGSEG
jgi:DNA gyrase subunit A